MTEAGENKSTLFCIILYNVLHHYYSSLDAMNCHRRKPPEMEIKAAEISVPHSGVTKSQTVTDEN